MTSQFSITRLIFLTVVITVTCRLSSVHAADRIVLRNLDIISGQQVSSFNEDGVKLSDKRTITWDQIEAGRVSEKQAEFDAMLKKVGEPLYRIRQRLQVEDYAGCLKHAEKLYPLYVARRSPSSYMVLQSLMWARIAAGHRERALIPYFRCYELVRKLDPAKVPLPGERRLQFDKETALTPELLPVWFDEKAATTALPDVVKAVRTVSQPLPDGARLYIATLALTAGKKDQAKTLLSRLQSTNDNVNQLRSLTLIQFDVNPTNYQSAVNQLERLLPNLNDANRVVATYWMGHARTMASSEADQQGGVLQLLRIPALHARQFPDLSAAALFAAMKNLQANDDQGGSAAIRSELLARFGQTYHAAQLKNGSKSGDDT